jgi:hypothetical protein
MTIAAVISRLENLAKQTKTLVESFRTVKIRPTKDQYKTLEVVNLKITEDAINISGEIEALKRRCIESASEKGKKLISEVESARNDLIIIGQFKNRIIFYRNITLFFENLKESTLDSAAIKARKKLIRERCDRICDLSSDRVISWAAAFTPSIWTGNTMLRDTFNYFIEDIKPEEAQI